MPGVKWTLKEAGGILDVLNSSVFNFKNWPMSSGIRSLQFIYFKYRIQFIYFN